jgi:hypothetical protein
VLRPTRPPIPEPDKSDKLPGTQHEAAAIVMRNGKRVLRPS